MVSMSVDRQAITLYARQVLPVIANHATGERSNTSTCPDAPIVDGPGRRPVFDDCEKTHAATFAFRRGQVVVCERAVRDDRKHLRIHWPYLKIVLIQTPRVLHGVRTDGLRFFPSQTA